MLFLLLNAIFTFKCYKGKIWENSSEFSFIHWILRKMFVHNALYIDKHLKTNDIVELTSIKRSEISPTFKLVLFYG